MIGKEWEDSLAPSSEITVTQAWLEPWLVLQEASFQSQLQQLSLGPGGFTVSVLFWVKPRRILAYGLLVLYPHFPLANFSPMAFYACLWTHSRVKTSKVECLKNRQKWGFWSSNWKLMELRPLGNIRATMPHSPPWLKAGNLLQGTIRAESTKSQD